jgi:hypothetical protein
MNYMNFKEKVKCGKGEFVDRFPILEPALKFVSKRYIPNAILYM